MVHVVNEHETIEKRAESGIADVDVGEGGSGEAGLNLLVVIVCYRVVELTIDCLRSLASQIHDIPGARVAVCENGTGPEAVEQLRSRIVANGWSDWVRLRAISPNVGFTGGNNAVLRDAMGAARPPKYFLLLNADTIGQPGALKELYESMERSPDVGIMGAHLVGLDGKPQVSCFRNHSALSEFLRGAASGRANRVFLRDNFQLAPPAGADEFDWVSFACAMIRSEAMRKIGLLDEGYFLYYDDADYCRMARKAGWKIGGCKTGRVVHLEGQSNDLPEKTRCQERKPRYYYVSRSRYFAKHLGAAGLWAANIGWTLGAALAAVRGFAGGRSSNTCEGEWTDIWTNAWAPVRKSNASLVPKESHVVV
jgi:N-acetylglucosaminyl-diphospho-decaprenol L-rhamnosyltransferase